MDEELSEHDLEERLYAMLHHVDETQNNLTDSQKNKHADVFENAPHSTMRRYWRVGSEHNQYNKVNISKEPPPVTKSTLNDIKSKEVVTTQRPLTPVDLTILQSPVPRIAQKTIEYIEHEPEAVVLESSDEDEVVEVALPPKPTITIESSDEEPVNTSPVKTNSKSNAETKNTERDATASPVLSVVSSVSDEFIRGDCIALNISSRHPDKQSFDFSLHGADLLVQNTPSKKKKKKKNKNNATSIPIVQPTSPPITDACFATPKSKAKNKKTKAPRRDLITEIAIPTPDIYDSDSNQSININRNKNPYKVTNNSLPNVDVYESDSNQSEIQKENTDQQLNTTYSSDSSTQEASKNTIEPVDLTENDNFITLDSTGINESIVIANVNGLTQNTRDNTKNDISKFVSSRVPSILNEDLDFDHLKGKDKVCKKRYSPSTLRAEMDKFYNESWGGENFNHREIQKHMSRDKGLWAIDPKDRIPTINRKVKCNYCNRMGHRDDTCRQKPPKCFMCGNPGHYEPRCPNKICLNCGSPNFMFSTMCRACSGWRGARCTECTQTGHVATHCPGLWRRYHDTTTNSSTLETCPQLKKPYQQYCSGCSRRGHLVHECRSTIPFSGFAINSPIVANYTPTFNTRTRSKSFSQESPRTSEVHNKKRQSKSPTVHETHANKKRNLSLDERAKSPIQKTKEKNKSIDTSVPVVTESAKNKNKTNVSLPVVTESAKSKNTTNELDKAPDFIPMTSNRDNEGHLIQDNEVSDTSDAVTSARIYVTNDIINKLKTTEGEDWLKANMEKLHVNVTHSDINSFLTIKGKVADQEAFQTELRDWSNKFTNNTKNYKSSEDDRKPECLLPKNRNNLIRRLNKSLDSLNKDLGDPRMVYNELTSCQNRHRSLTKQKVVNPQLLKNNRKHINNMLVKLNSILLGQAGLAGGTEHVNELHIFRQYLLSTRNKIIPTPIHKDIAEHYDRIFSSDERDDYSDLMNKYYSTRPERIHNTKPIAQKGRKKRKRINRLKFTSITNEEEETHNVGNPAQETGQNMPIKNYVQAPENIQTKISPIHFHKLKFYHQRLLKAIPKDKSSKTLLCNLRRRVTTIMLSLNNKEHVSSKTAKKVMGIQKEAQMFLSANVI